MSWESYIAWAQLPQLTEVISLDTMLCPNLIEDLIEEDWEHNVQEDFCISYFRDLDYLLGRVGQQPAHILAIMREPPLEAQALWADARFVFLGYDLIEAGSGMSALTNCCGFPLAFAPTDLSALGLIADFEQAREIQRLLLEHYPDEIHAECDLWAIWKLSAAT